MANGLPAAPGSANKPRRRYRPCARPDLLVATRALTSPARTTRPRLGILLMIGAIFCLSVMEAGAKYLTQYQPYEMVVWGRYLFHFLLTVPLFLTPATIRLVRTGRPAMHVLRSLFLAGGTLAGIGAISLMPLAEATALVFSAPLLVTLMSPWLLNEPVGWRRRAAIAVGFLGVVIILRPGTDFLQWAALLPLLASLCYACYQVSTRLLSFSEHPLTLFFYTSVVGLAVTTPMALVVWSPMTGIEWLILLFVGFFGFAGQFLLIKAFQLAEASTVAPFIYVQLLFAGFFGWRLFGDLPDVWVLLGAAVVICSGLYIWRRETRRSRAD